MINIKPAVMSALKANSTLIGLLGGSRIYFQGSGIVDELPRITYFEVVNIGSLYADDVEATSEIHIQIDIWSKGSTSAMAEEVDKTMKSLGFGRTSSADLYEDDTKIFHKAMRFAIIKEV
ncbi:MAG: DUF3168 domain-containing protein [Peptococcaceae bacterium]|nr:DUF3168 domain-containing protein [Peptococcaceae bacterium]